METKKIINEEANYKTETAYLEFIKNNAFYETFYYVQSSTGGMKGGMVIIIITPK